MFNSDKFTEELFAFLNYSTSPQHVCRWLSERLTQGGFAGLSEPVLWNTEKPVFFSRDGSFIAYKPGRRPVTAGLRLVGTHTDSPSLKLRPGKAEEVAGYSRCRVEVYGGALLYTWYDRDLGLAGEVYCQNEHGKVIRKLYDSGRPLAIIPSIAIHLDRKVGEGKIPEKNKEINPIFYLKDDISGLNDFLLAELRKDGSGIGGILSHELKFYDTQPPQLVGANANLIASPRLDNLLSVFSTVKAFLEADCEFSSIFVSTNYEEIGSRVYSSAGGELISSFLEPVFANAGEKRIALANSFLLSVDNAHAVHPGAPERLDDENRPILNQGPSLKLSAGRSYISDAECTAFFTALADEKSLPLQVYTQKNTIPAGSTIGPIISSRLGIPGVDIGIPTLAMHSIRELCGKLDPVYTSELVRAYFETSRPHRIENI